MSDAVLHLVGQVVSLINDSPKVEGNNITVDLQTDHSVQCSIRLAKMSSSLRDCESISFLLHWCIAIVYQECMIGEIVFYVKLYSNSVLIGYH